MLIILSSYAPIANFLRELRLSKEPGSHRLQMKHLPRRGMSMETDRLTGSNLGDKDRTRHQMSPLHPSGD